MSDIASYFNRYDRKSPAREAFLQSGEEMPQWLDDPALEKVTAENYPKLYRAIMAECAFRNIERPDFYIDKSEDTSLGTAYYALNTILIEYAAYKVFDEKELRALVAHEIKHLYQDVPENDEETRLNELDADRAAVQSTDYETIQSYAHKAASLRIDRVVPKPLQNLVHKFHETFPNFIGENTFVSLKMKSPESGREQNGRINWLLRAIPVELDREHDSPARRMKEMRAYEEGLISQHERDGLVHLNLDR